MNKEITTENTLQQYVDQGMLNSFKVIRKNGKVTDIHITPIKPVEFIEVKLNIQ